MLKAGTGWQAAPAAGARTKRIDEDRSTSNGLRPSWLRGGKVLVLDVAGSIGARRLLLLASPRDPSGALFTRRQHQGGGARRPRQGREAATKERTLDEGEHVATLGLAMGPRDCLSWGAWALFTSRKCRRCGAANDLLCRHRFGDSRSELCGKASLAARLSSISSISSISSSTIGRFSPPREVGGPLASPRVRGEVGATDREPQAAVANPSRTPPS